jgi:hypothetical protein
LGKNLSRGPVVPVTRITRPGVQPAAGTSVQAAINPHADVLHTATHITPHRIHKIREFLWPANTPRACKLSKDIPFFRDIILRARLEAKHSLL